MALSVVNQDAVDDGTHHLIKKRQLGCNCFSGWSCHSDLSYDSACGCMICGSAPIINTPRTTTTSSRCDKICVGRRPTTRDRCPTCYSGANKYSGGYYCCGGSSGATCGGYFSDNACACRYKNTDPVTIMNDCIAYDGGCGYFNSVKFDGACSCFVCG